LAPARSAGSVRDPHALTTAIVIAITAMST
jgi:hypothetical protein